MSSKYAAARGSRELLRVLLHFFEKDNEVQALSLTDPAIHLLAEKIIPNGTSKQRAAFARKLREMERVGFIQQGRKYYALSARGYSVLTEEEVWALTIPTPKRWDGKWRMVLFDIPAKKGRQRNALRARLKELGLVLYQNSVWVYPYPLADVVRAIAKFYSISDCVLFAVADELNGEAHLKRQFNLK